MHVASQFVQAWSSHPELMLAGATLMGGGLGALFFGFLASRAPRPTEDHARENSVHLTSSAASLDGEDPSAAQPPDAEAIIRGLSTQRNSKVFAFVHGYEQTAFGKEPAERWMSDHDLQRFVLGLSDMSPDQRLDIILHSTNGDPKELIPIARAIKRHKGETTVFIPHYAKGWSGLIALSADNVVMGPSAFISFESLEDEDLAVAVKQKGARHADDASLLRLHGYNNCRRQISSAVCEISHGGKHKRGCGLGENLIAGKYSGSRTLGASAASKLGMKVSGNMPPDCLNLIRAFQYVPETLYAGTGSRLTAARAGDPTRPIRGVCASTCNIAVRPALKRMEDERKSRVLCMIHAEGTESAAVDELTAIEFLNSLSRIDPNVPLDIILHTPGGNALEGQHIGRAIKAHAGKKTVFVPFHAFSAGTLISLAADEIVMSPFALLGPIDTQIPLNPTSLVPTSAFASLLSLKPKKRIGDRNLARAIKYRDMIAQDHKDAVELMRGTYSNRAANRIVHTLNDGTLTHDYQISFDEARKLGLRVSSAMPPEPVEIVREICDDGSMPCSVIFCSS